MLNSVAVFLRVVVYERSWGGTILEFFFSIVLIIFVAAVFFSYAESKLKVSVSHSWITFLVLSIFAQILGLAFATALLACIACSLLLTRFGLKRLLF